MSLFNPPKAILLLIFTQLWNRFSHYGMRTLLLLYMIKAKQMPELAAIGTFAIYCAFVELGGVLGTFIADTILGLRRSVILGGWLIGAGHLLLALDVHFLGALSLIILGSGLYTTNVATLLGYYYPIEDSKREQGFTLFYMSINAGAFVATLLCGFIAEKWGWNYGFGLAALGMILSNGCLLLFHDLLENKGETPHCFDIRQKFRLVGYLLIALVANFLLLYMQQVSAPLLPWMIALVTSGIMLKLGISQWKNRDLFISLIISFGAMVLFFAAQEQIGCSLLLFADHTLSTSFSAMSLLAINPLVIMMGGPAAHYCLQKIQSRQGRLALPFLLATVGFGMLSWGTLMTGSLGVFLIGGVIAILSFAELLIGPMTYCACSEASLKSNNPHIMALIPLGFAMAAALGGMYSKVLAGDEGFNLSQYCEGFGLLAMGLLAIASVLLQLKKHVGEPR